MSEQIKHAEQLEHAEQDEQVLDVVHATRANDAIEQFEEVDDGVSQTRSRPPAWFAPAWFLFGILVGIVGFAGYTALVNKSSRRACRRRDCDARCGPRRRDRRDRHSE